MKRNTLNFVIDFISLLVMWGLITTGLLMKYIMPPGTGHWLALGGMNRHGWGEVHFWLAVGACVLLFLHVLLHWPWVVGTVQRMLSPAVPSGATLSRARRALWGTGLLAVLVVVTVGLLAAANAMIVELEPSPEELEEHLHHAGLSVDHEDPRGGDALSSSAGGTEEQKAAAANDAASSEPHHRIRCGITLAEAAVLKHMTMAEFRRRLGIPASVPETATIGDAGAEHGFTVHDVRALKEGRAPTTAPR